MNAATAANLHLSSADASAKITRAYAIKDAVLAEERLAAAFEAAVWNYIEANRDGRLTDELRSIRNAARDEWRAAQAALLAIM